MSENNSIHLFVFSFNRGQFLNNCILSVRKCAAEVPLTVIDDCSNDPDTLLVLEKLRKDYEVISNDKIHQKEKKTGGLAGSMNQAMEIASSRNVQYAFFLQDDMQFVRTMRDIDLANVEKYFELIENTFQISTNFIRQISSDAYLSKNGIVAGGRAYVRRDEIANGKSYFSDTGIFTSSVSKIISATLISVKIEIASVRNPEVLYVAEPFTHLRVGAPIQYRFEARKDCSFIMQLKVLGGQGCIR